MNNWRELTVLVAFTAAATASEHSPTIVVSPAATVATRPGITGAGWAANYGGLCGAAVPTKIVHLYPNHPDDWGKSAGTGSSYSLDQGQTWQAGPDDAPLPGMIDAWQDRLSNGKLITFGIRFVPTRDKAIANPATAGGSDPYRIGVSQDQGRTWEEFATEIHCPEAIGVVARPLPRILEDRQGRLLMPAYSWSKTGSRALLLRSADGGRNWGPVSTVIAGPELRTCGVTLTTCYLEAAVARVANGSLLAVMRTGSGSRSPLVFARSGDEGATWSRAEKLEAGPEGRAVPGKLPGLCLLPNSVLVLLTAHTKNHCRLYVSHDGSGRKWSEGLVVTSQSGGNTSMVGIDNDSVLVFTPASGCIHAWRARIPARAATAHGTRSAAEKIVFDGKNRILSWQAPAAAAAVSHFLVTPILVSLPPGNLDTDIYPYAAILVPGEKTQLDLSRVLLPGAEYRFQVLVVSR